MEQFIGFIIFIVYILLFLIFSFLAKQKKKTPVQRQQQPKPASKDLQAKMEDFFGELQKRFGQEQAQPSRQEPVQPKKPTRLVISPAEDWQELDILETTDLELQASLETPAEGLSTIETPTKRLLQVEPVSRMQPSKPPSVPSLLSFDKRYGYLRGILMAEILGPPVSKRRRNIDK